MGIDLERISEDKLPELCGLWNGSLGVDFPMRERIMRQNVFEDPNVLTEGSRMAVSSENGAVVGLVVAKVLHDPAAAEQDIALIGKRNGWIHALLVDPAYRYQGIGGRLLAHAEAALIGVGAKRIVLGSDMHRRVLPGLPEWTAASSSDLLPESAANKAVSENGAAVFFEQRGYAHGGTVYDLHHAYRADDQIELPISGTGERYRMAGYEDKDALCSFMRRCFPGSWAYQTEQYWACGGTGREFVLLERKGEIAGFCRINDADSPLLAQNIYWSLLFQGELGGIGPLGIDEQYRGHKYGLGIVQAAVYFLRLRDIAQIVIDMTPYVDFYGKHGFRVWKRYGLYAKEV